MTKNAKKCLEPRGNRHRSGSLAAKRLRSADGRPESHLPAHRRLASGRFAGSGSRLLSRRKAAPRPSLSADPWKCGRFPGRPLPKRRQTPLEARADCRTTSFTRAALVQRRHANSRAPDCRSSSRRPNAAGRRSRVKPNRVLAPLTAQGIAAVRRCRLSPKTR